MVVVVVLGADRGGDSVSTNGLSLRVDDCLYKFNGLAIGRFHNCVAPMALVKLVSLPWPSLPPLPPLATEPPLEMTITESSGGSNTAWFVPALGGTGLTLATAWYFHKYYCARQRETNGGVPWPIDATHDWQRIQDELCNARLTAVTLDQTSRYDCKENSVVEAAHWFVELLKCSEDSCGERVRDLDALIRKKQAQWQPVAATDDTPLFAVQVLCAVQMRAGRPVQLVWTAHFGTEKNPGAGYVDLFVTANDATGYGPGYGRLVARLHYTTITTIATSDRDDSGEDEDHREKLSKEKEQEG